MKIHMTYTGVEIIIAIYEMNIVEVNRLVNMDGILSVVRIGAFLPVIFQQAVFVQGVGSAIRNDNCIAQGKCRVLLRHQAFKELRIGIHLPLFVLGKYAGTSQE